MALKSSFFNSINGDRRYDAKVFADYFASFIGNGVFPNPSSNLQVVEGGNMKTIIRSGKAWINGYFLINDSDYVLTHDNADGVLKRIDRIVLRLNYVARQIEITIKKGTFASSPTAPTLQRDNDIYELAIADVLINNGATQITQANITDTRLNNALCGIVHSTVEQVDTTSIFNQYLAKLEELDDVLDGDVAANLLSIINAHKGDLASQSAGKGASLIGIQDADNLFTATTVETALKEVKQKSNSADKLATVRQIDGINFDGTTNLTRYITSSTAAATVAKTATLSTFNLVSGAELTLRLTNGNTSANPTLNVSSKGAKGLYEMIDGVATPIGELPANSILKLVYDTSIVSGGAFIVLGKGGGVDLKIEAGDFVIAADLAMSTLKTGTFTKIKEWKWNGKSGTIRISFTIYSASANATAQGRIYINDVAVGIQRNTATTSSSPLIATEDFTVNKGDLIQIYVRNVEALNVYVKDFMIKIAENPLIDINM